jgi:hypothetical protein
MLRSFFENNPQDDDQPVFWHRLIGSTVVTVGTA